MDVLCASLRKLILSPALTDETSVDVLDITDALSVARKNKLAILFKRSIGTDAPPDVQKLFAEDLQKIAFLNSKILQIIQAANRALGDAGIRHAFYKGPLQQKILYGDYYAKPCLDADILVSPKDFKLARAALLNAGFRVPEGYSGLWWTFFLGEQPLLAPGQLYTLDLHHRLQQPGSPAPRHITEFLDDVTPVALGSQVVPAIGLRGIAMVAAMNLVKAVYHREPTGGHALDVLVALNKMTADGIEDTKARARPGFGRYLDVCGRTGCRGFWRAQSAGARRLQAAYRCDASAAADLCGRGAEPSTPENAVASLR
ncbi:nucleotidyltransferase family protein [Asticcacaulis sp. 201]|uniref:nucleotidyltransferase family protein n=1 Tax=Asticcacaulis sp. 201 TaxID=3028787 RepID=UPI002915EEA8|nr:nucleotidyltransferase family protein [Asticcacaulis sp. 201]MDV6331091.1 nucleotidyltransferase family protein [Asticcacaulis sp. 201]